MIFSTKFLIILINVVNSSQRAFQRREPNLKHEQVSNWYIISDCTFNKHLLFIAVATDELLLRCSGEVRDRLVCDRNNPWFLEKHHGSKVLQWSHSCCLLQPSVGLFHDNNHFVYPRPLPFSTKLVWRQLCCWILPVWVPCDQTN